MIYLMGSLRNWRVPEVAKDLRSAGFEVFDDWYAAGPEADDMWQAYELGRDHTFAEALEGEAACNVFGFDQAFLDECDTAVLVMPAGKSAHMELGYMRGQRKKAFVLFDAEPERYDVMYKLATGVCFSVEELIERLK